jgi:(S)-ureidoglycine aminohydrolase
MKIILLLPIVLFFTTAKGQMATPAGTPIRSDVYSWKNLLVDKKEKSERRPIVNGKSAVLANMEIHASTLQPKTGPQPRNTHTEEVMLLIKEGSLKVTLGDQSKTMGPGSVAFAISGDAIGVENMGTTNATYYIFKLKTIDSIHMARAKTAGGSFFLDWNDIAFKAHDKGGVRQYFNRPTATLRKLDIHVTTLNAGLKSHDAHTHRAEEIILMIDGNAEMQIDKSFKKTTTGDLIYLESNIPHAIRNDDTKACMYYAIQWE